MFKKGSQSRTGLGFTLFDLRNYRPNEMGVKVDFCRLLCSGIRLISNWVRVVFVSGEDIQLGIRLMSG